MNVVPEGNRHLRVFHAVLIAAMRASDTGTAIWSLILASLVGLATGNLLGILQRWRRLKKSGSGPGREISPAISPELWLRLPWDC